LMRRLRPFPDRSTVALVSRLGVRSVILHESRARGTPWEGAARRPIGGLGMVRRRRDGLVVYEIRSPSGDERGPAKPAAGSSHRSSR
jgi:hypothetical protein